jgi:hypothetical protein
MLPYPKRIHIKTSMNLLEHLKNRYPFKDDAGLIV